MEAVGVFHDEEWESLSKMFSFEDSDFPPNCNGNYNLFPNQPSLLADESSFLPSANLDHMTNFYCEISPESSNSSEIEGTLLAENGHDANFVDHDVTANTFDQSMHYFCNNEGFMAPVFSDDVMQEILHLKAELLKMDNNAGLIQTAAAENMGFCNEMQQQLKRKYETSQDKNNNSSDQGPKKKARVSRDAAKSKKGPEKDKKAIEISNDDEENNNGGGNGQSSTTNGSSEEDNSNGKGKASRGTATDPQSVYARRRRERINERLRILQNLVPNGTKVDISTMLEEAVHYVKFLQLQIKLLSSDDMWMYAPLAYNGMDMGLYHKIMPNAWPQN